MCGARYLYVEEMTSTLVQTKSDPYANRVGLERPWWHELQLRALEQYTAQPRADWNILVHYPRYSACPVHTTFEEFLRWEVFRFYCGTPTGMGLGFTNMPSHCDAPRGN